MSVVISIDDIMNSQKALLATEIQNKTTLTSMDFNALKTNLYTWASLGFPDSFLAFTFTIVSPTMINGNCSCSDGVARGIWDYVPFCLGTSIQTLVDGYQAQIQGINLSFSLSASPYVLNLHVTKA